MLRFSVNDSAARALIAKIRLIAGSAGFDQPLEIASNRVLRDLVLLTPKKWTGLTRQSWSIIKTAEGERSVRNTSKVMLFLEGGTGNAGTPTSNGGYIYPKTKMFLYIPLTAAASFGWQPGMVFGLDYVLAKRVRGIKAMHIVKNYRATAAKILKEEMKAFLQRSLT